MKKNADKKNNNDRLFKIQEIHFDQLDYKLRPQQEEALKWSEETIFSGKKFLILEMPTGVGKSIFSQYFCKMYVEKINSKAKFDLLTNTKILQTQYTDEFKFVNNLWGKSNYECDRWNNTCEYGKICNGNSKKGPCEDCPYDESMSRWLDGKISLTNFHIHGLYSLFNPKPHEIRKADVLIVDEAHLLEEVINGFVSFSLNAKSWKNILSEGLGDNYELTLAKFNNISQIAEWVKKVFLIDLGTSEAEHRKQLPFLKDKKWEQKIKVIKDLEEMKNKLDRFVSDYYSKTSDWVADKQIVKGELTWIIQPLWTSEIMRNCVWGRYKHVILMSGTIIDPLTFSYINGIDVNQMEHLSQPSPFPVQNRLIYYYNNGKMTYNSKENTWQSFIPVIKKILKKYKGKKGIIHCGNYEIMEWMKRDLDDERLIYADANKREESLNEHINRVDDCVIVSPSMIHGVNLYDDLSRFQVILKMPYPSLSSKVNRQRLDTKPQWYSWRTVSDLVQAYGRSIRSEVDYADTFILDGCFGDILAQSNQILPKYFIEAIRRMK